MMTEAKLAVLEWATASQLCGFELRLEAMKRLSQLPDYEWSGVYRLEGDTLILDAYVGDETDHTHIPVGRGVCGTAVAEDRDIVVEDVRLLDNYLACCLKTRSEIVVLIRQGDQVLGQIDIDGHRVGAFGDSDRAFLTELARVLAQRWSDQEPGGGTPGSN